MKIGDICTYAPKSTIKAGDAVADGKYMFFTSSTDESKRYNDYQLDCEGIIMGTGGNATLHYYCGKFSTSTDCVVLLPNSNIRCKYLYYFFLCHMPALENGFKGAGLKHTNKNHINNIEISHLPSIKMQDETITVLDKVCEVIAYRQQQLQKLDDLVKARFVEMFENISYPTERFSRFIESLTSGSRGWAKYCVDDGSEWFITIKNVKNCCISTNNMQPINAPRNAEAIRTKVKEGDLLISITADLGRTGVVSKEIAEHGAYINQHLTCIRVDRKIINPLFIAYYLDSPAGKMQFEAKNQSAVKAGLNFEAINSLMIKVPPIELQNEFETFVQQVDKSKFVVQQALDKAQLLFDSLMQQYFG